MTSDEEYEVELRIGHAQKTVSHLNNRLDALRKFIKNEFGWQVYWDPLAQSWTKRVVPAVKPYRPRPKQKPHGKTGITI
jgi:hypothetical protein